MPIFPFFQYPYMNRYYTRNNYNRPNINESSNSYENTNISNLINNQNNDIEINNTENNKYNNEVSSNCDNYSSRQNKSSRYSGLGPIHFQNPFSMNSEEPIIEILGISLYLDDIIILGLLFFLYQEGVKDYMLYLALIMLLLS